MKGERHMKKALRLFGSVVLFVILLVGSVFAGEKVFFYHTDPVGTPLAITDDKGNVVWRKDYKPFGEDQSTTGTVENNKQFVGKEKDEETVLINFNQRQMNPNIGRFYSPDPVGPVDPWTSKTNYKMLLNPQRLNRYAYGLNNPYRYIDLDGNFPIDTVWDIGNVLYDVYNRDWTSAAADTGAMFIPYVPAGMTKLAKGVDKAIDASKAAKWGRAETLVDHFQRHGKDFGAKSAEEYANMASDFLGRAQKENLPTKIDSKGLIRVYEPKTNTFGAYNPDGTTATFYKPPQGQKYWDRQQGASPWTP